MMHTEYPFAGASLGKILRLAEILGGEGGNITASMVVQRITREAMWGLNSSLGISGGSGTMSLQLEGFVSYHRYNDAHESGDENTQDGYQGSKFYLGNIPLDMKAEDPSPHQSPAEGLPTAPSITTSSFLNPTVASTIPHQFAPLVPTSDVSYSLSQQVSNFSAIHHNTMLLSPQLDQSPYVGIQSVSPFPSAEDSVRKRFRESTALNSDDSNSDQLEGAYIDEENVSVPRLQLHVGDIHPVPGHGQTSLQAHDEASYLTPHFVVPAYPLKSHKIGTSRPRKKQSPAVGSASGLQFGVDNGGTGVKKRSVISLVERIWHGIYNGTKLSKQFRGEIGLGAARGVSSQLKKLGSSKPITQQAFEDINTHCSRLYSSTGSFRILDLIMQAVWVDLFHARVTALASEPQNQYNSPTDNNILALKESRSVFGCSEKEMRNKLAIWSGYKKIKDIGGWPALIFAEEGGGVYNVCKYRAGGWKEGIFDELEHLRDAIELAADALQPEWRRLIIEVLFDSQNETRGRSWEGHHPHSWVIDLVGVPVPLGETYNDGLEYELIEASAIDREVWGNGDPRCMIPIGDEPYTCNACGELQSEEALGNKCLCFPDLYGGGSGRRGGKYAPVQVFRTKDKGNGLVARLPIPAGAGIGEFVGQVTRGLRGVDVMEGGVEPNKYQISQQRRGNFTRFINHSCHPNAHFKVFIWLGVERIIVVSNGVGAGAEITVDYSHGYWEGSDRSCKCGEVQCRYPGMKR